MQEKNASRRAALTGAIEGRAHHIAHHLLRQCRAVGDHGVETARLGNERHDGVAPVGKRALDRPSRFARAGEGDATNAKIFHQRFAKLAGTRHELQNVLGDAGFVQNLNSQVCRDGCLLSWLGDDRVAGGQGSGHLARENRQWEVPGANARKNAARSER